MPRLCREWVDTRPARGRSPRPCDVAAPGASLPLARVCKPTGARYHRELGNGFGLTAYGDVGGFGIGAHTDWQVLGTIDYSLSESWNLHLGYRSLNFNITGSEGRFGFNVHMRGPIIAGTFRF
jgi:hypothetical protein